jgi:hypothetical protein
LLRLPRSRIESITSRTHPLSILLPVIRLQGESNPNMQYAMLVYTNSKRWDELSKDERNRVHADCAAWHHDLEKRGKTRGAIGLQAGSNATTVGDRNGRIVITDGPFAETREVLGGLEIVDCKDLDEAIAIAKCFPALRVGSLMEVRPMVEGGECRD